MAPAIEGQDSRSKIRRSRAARDAHSLILPPWTRGNDSDDEVELKEEQERQRRRFRSRHKARQFSNPPPPQETNGGSFQTMPNGSPGSIPRPPPSFQLPPPPVGNPSGGDSGGTPTAINGGSTPALTQASDGPDSITATITSNPNTALAPGPEPTESGPDSNSDSGPDSDGADSSASESDFEDSRPVPTPKPTLSSVSPVLETGQSLVPASSTISAPDDGATAESAREGQRQHHRNVETALTAVGSIAGVICIGVGAWLLCRMIKRRRNRSPPPPASAPKPRRRVRFLAHVPLLKSRFADRTWFNIDRPYAVEKPPVEGYDLLGYMPDKPVATVQRTRVVDVGNNGYFTTTTGDLGEHRHSVSPVSSQDPSPFSPTESSLSSAFGNGTYIPPTPLHPPPARADLNPPLPRPPAQTHLYPPSVRHRDTVYTESSEASSLPRFRNINSWVRSQARRVRRASEVPEQGFGLMMPDSEEPRRVIVAPNGVGYAT